MHDRKGKRKATFSEELEHKPKRMQTLPTQPTPSALENKAGPSVVTPLDDKKQKREKNQKAVQKLSLRERPNDPAYNCPLCPENLTSKIERGFLKPDMVVQQHINLVHPDDDLSLKDEFVYLRHHVVFMTDILLSV